VIVLIGQCKYIIVQLPGIRRRRLPSETTVLWS